MYESHEHGWARSCAERIACACAGNGSGTTANSSPGTSIGANAQSGPPGDWPSYNHDLLSTRYSPLHQISTANVASLHRRCSVRLREVGALQAGPLVRSGIIYVTTSNDTYAIDGASCRMLWTNVYTPTDKTPFPVDLRTRPL